MTVKTNPTYNSELYIGSIDEKTKKPFTYDELVYEISKFQDDSSTLIPLCVSPVEYISGSQYREKGWKISAINYPKVGNLNFEIDHFMMSLADILKFRFNQHRVTVVGTTKTSMIV